MARLTKQQTAELRSILARLEQAERYVYNPRVAVCSIRDQATNALDYVPHFGTPFEGGPAALVPILKEAGSDLVALPDGTKRLGSFLVEHGFSPRR